MRRQTPQHQDDDGDGADHAVEQELQMLEGEDEEDLEEGEGTGFSATAATPSSPGIPAPAPADVICGRGKMTSSHPGNRRFRESVLEKKQAYQRARRRDDKTRITFELVQALRDGGSKFLLFNNVTGLWDDVGDEYAREKVSHSLRSRPNDHRRTKPKPSRKSNLKKTEHSPAIDTIVSQLIHEQQSLLKTMIDTETRSAAVELSMAGRDEELEA